jgi:hypothetical protein
VGIATAEKLDKAGRLPSEKQTRAQRVIASEAADKFMEISMRFDSHLEDLRPVGTVLEESGVGYISWLAQDPLTNGPKLEAASSSIDEILFLTESSTLSLGTFLGSLENVRGITLELNTAINIMVNSTTGVMDALDHSIKLWRQLIQISRSS